MTSVNFLQVVEFQALGKQNNNTILFYISKFSLDFGIL